MKPLTIKSIERNFPNQWLLVEVTETKDGAPSKGIVLEASHDRPKVVAAMGSHSGKKLYFFFSGITTPTETAFAM